MAAVFLPAARPELPHHLLLPEWTRGGSPVEEEVRHGLGLGPHPSLGGPDAPFGSNSGGAVVLHANHWPLTLPELRAVKQRLQQQALELITVESANAQTLVAAAALGVTTLARADIPPASPAGGQAVPPSQPLAGEPLTIHRGTLRSGDHLQVEGSLLVLGDVNPGARVSATGHVLIWGRLRGIAHAGSQGDGSARIVALELRPLQLRIAAAVARGPEDRPPPGLSEEARLVDGAIQIDPARPIWPLGG